MVKIRDRVAQLVALRADDGITDTAFTAQIENQWSKADDAIQDIFGGSDQLERTLSASRVVDAFDRLVDALSSEENFLAASLANGPDKLQGFHDRTAGNVGATFNRRESTATARLGVLRSTRFGAAVFNSTPNAKKGYEDAEAAQAFAWSTMDNIRRATDMTASGEATYEGRTLVLLFRLDRRFFSHSPVRAGRVQTATSDASRNCRCGRLSGLPLCLKPQSIARYLGWDSFLQ